MSEKREDGGPAFPRPLSNGQLLIAGDERNIEVAPQAGMSLRDYYAAAALTGMLANGSEVVLKTFTATNRARHHETIGETYAEAAYEWADAMLKARNE